MRPINDERIITEYVRVHRLIESDLFADGIEPFADDLLARLTEGVDLSGRWWKKDWHLGNVEARRVRNGAVTSITGQFGWFGEAQTQDAPPPYDPTTHQWSTEPAKKREGALALFVLDTPSQIAAVTSLAGDASVPGFCKALTDLLNQAEIQASADAAVRTNREWLVEPVDERGTFEAWVGTMDKVTRVSAAFHLPNPRSNDDIDPIVNFLNELSAINGNVSAQNPGGLDPYGHPLMRGAIAMQENDYGSVRAKGMRPNGDEDEFASREHPVRDVLPADPQDPTLSMAGVLAKILRALAERLERGLQ